VTVTLTSPSCATATCLSSNKHTPA
jgi:hypothetical protein